MNVDYNWVNYAYVGSRFVFMGLVFAAFFMAWRKYRHLGFGVLAGWALASGSWSLLQSGWLRFVLQNIGGSAGQQQLIMLSNFVAVLVLHALLVVGAGLLVWVPIKPVTASQT